MAPKVYIIIYSLYHHIYTLAQEVQKGLESTGVEAKIFQGKAIAYLCIKENNDWRDY